jgi:transposase
MRFKARSMNAYLSASNLAHMPEQIKWATAKRGVAAHSVKAAYSSQECSRCHAVVRANRVSQQTFCCVHCGYQDHADHNASLNVASRWGDQELAACQSDISPWLKPGASSSRGEAFLLRRKLACTVPVVVALTFSSIGVTFPEPQGSFSI